MNENNNLNNQTVQSNNNTLQQPTQQPMNNTTPVIQQPVTSSVQETPQIINNVQETPTIQPQNNIQITPQPEATTAQMANTLIQNIQTPPMQNVQTQQAPQQPQANNQAPAENNIQQTSQTNTTKDKNIMRFVPLLLLLVVLGLGIYVGRDKITSFISKDKKEEINNTETTDKNKPTNNDSNNNSSTENNNQANTETPSTDNNQNNNEQTTQQPETNSNTNNNQQTTQQTTQQPETNNNTNNTNTNCSTTPIWNGVYTNGANSIKLYQISPSEINYTGNINNSWLIGTADEIVGNKAIGEIFDTYTFELCNNTLNFSTTDEELQAATFTRTSDYTKNDYYTDNFGDPAYLNTELNGIFKNGNLTLKLYQTSSTEASILITGNGYYGTNVNVVGNTIDYEDESFGETEKINITISGNTLTLICSDTDPDGMLNSFSGTYTKESNYTMDQIIQDN